MDINRISNRTIARILAWIGGFIVLALVIVKLRRQLIWVGAAFFLALAMEPAVSRLSRYLPRKSRGLAALIVLLMVVGILAFIGVVLAPPLAKQFNQLLHDIPKYYNNFLHSHNPLSDYLRQHDIKSLAGNYQERILSGAAGGSAFGIFGSIITGIIGVITILSLTFFMVLEGPNWIEKFWRYYSPRDKGHKQKLFAEMYKSVTGYVNGNIITSIIATVATIIFLEILRVPYSFSLGFLVGILDLVPLIGATLAATLVALMVLIFGSVTKAIIVIIFFVVYQQIENHALQPLVYSKTVQISPLVVAIAALFAAVLGGLIGALVAIPLAASGQILLKDYLERHPLGRGGEAR